MRLLLLIGIMFSFLSTKEVEVIGKAKKIEKGNYYELKELEYTRDYDSTINFIKYHEGFRANWYMDVNYLAIGYGQRQACYKKTIIAPITKDQATIILKDSFNEHIKLVRYYYPKFNRNQTLAVAHMSYSIGLGNVQKNKYLYNENGSWKLSVYNVLNARKIDKKPNYRKNREFEINLFNK